MENFKLRHLRVVTTYARENIYNLDFRGKIEKSGKELIIKQHQMKPKTEDVNRMVFNQRNGSISTMSRIIIGVFLATLFILKDLSGVIVFGIARMFKESLRWLIKLTVKLAKEMMVTITRAILRGIEELLIIVIGIIVQVVDNGSRVVIRGLRQMVSVLCYLVVVIAFSFGYVALRIISIFSPGK